GAGGWLHNLGVLDFAGGSVIHINSGIAALTAAFVIGPRLGYKRTQGEAHDTTYIVLGAAFLWFGWFGFNAGSAVIAGTLATSAFGTGLFATVLVNPGAANGLLYGNPAQLGIQLIDIGAVWGYSFLATGLILLAIKKTIGLRVSAKQEEEGLDATQHGEKAYSEEVQSRLTTQTSAKLELVVKDSDREIIAEMIRKRQTLQVDLSTGVITTTEKEQKD